MGEQHFCLRWNHHQSTLIRVFEALLHDESLVDVTLYAEGRHMRAHKVVLSACSGYFQTIFAAHTEAHPVIILKDVAFSELRALVDYMYRGEVSVSQDQLGSLIRTAESLQVKGLADGAGAGAKVHHNHQQQHQETTSVSPAAGPPPPLQPLPAAPPSPPAPPPQPLQLALPARSTSPHAVTPLPAAAVPRYEHLNGTSSPVLQQPSAKRARWPSADAAATPTLSSILLPATSRTTPPPPAVVPQPEQLPRIPATITPVPAAAPRRPDTPETPELDLSVRSSAPLDVKQEQLSSLMESHSDSGGELDAGSEGDAPPGPSTNFLQHAVGLHNSTAVDPSVMQHGFMKWPLSEGSVTGGGGGGDSPFGQQTDGTASQDVFLQRALNARFQQLLQQQRYDQLVAASSPVPPSTGPPPPPSCVGLPLLLRRESPTSPGKQYPCDKCGRHYASSGNLKRHIKYECGVEPQFQCPVCKKKFQHRHSVKIHVVSTHKTENPELIKDYLL